MSDPIDLTELSQMRGVMHPARWRVLEEFYDGASLTATQAGALVNLSASAMSYHLKQLGKIGLITRGGSADGREHPWRAVGSRWGATGQPDAAVGTAMMRNVLASITRALGAPPPEDPAERPWPASFTQTQLRLTRADARRLHDRVRALIAEFEDASPQDDEFTHDVFWISAARTAEQHPTSN